MERCGWREVRWGLTALLRSFTAPNLITSDLTKENLERSVKWSLSHDNMRGWWIFCRSVKETIIFITLWNWPMTSTEIENLILRLISHVH